MVTPQTGTWERWAIVDMSLCQTRLLQGQARWHMAGPGQQAHEVLAVPRQAVSVTPTLGYMVAR